MPSAPLVDPTTLDLGRTYATRAEVYARLPHTGRFALLDAVAVHEREGNFSAGWKDIRADDWWAPDHIPGRPLFPGVLMIEGGAQLASWDFLERHPEVRGFVGFGGVNEARFRGTVVPGSRLVWVARPVRTRARMFVYAVQGFVAGDLVFEAEIIGALL
jgi:3-hydroxyacyl-[acyl-carrier-protein] dehydratase